MSAGVRAARTLSVVAVGILAAVVFLVCKSDRETGDGGSNMSDSKIERILHEHTEAWMRLPGVVGVGIGETEGQPCIKIFASEKSEELARVLPDSVEGIPVLIQVTGEFNAHGDSSK
jgi:hypothetical protein